MSDFTSIAAVGSSLARYLEFSFRQLPPVPGKTTAVNLVRTEDLNRETSPLIKMPSLSIYLYRVGFNKVMRAAWSAKSQYDGRSHVPLDLHFLLVAWGENADHEFRILGRAVQCMEDTPILTGPLLDPIAPWASNESIQVCLEDISTEDVMRTFDSLPLDYKLSIPYVARLAVIHGERRDSDTVVTNLGAGITPDLATE
ncbi:MAG: DUF4255 domain-containing protein [Gammaproteobacteria bacterium]|nr:DUF4255 domain-containing protein [Gammaproteobacteria bacterium]